MGGANFDSYHAGSVENNKVTGARWGLCAKDMIAMPQEIIRNQQFVGGACRARWDMSGRLGVIFARMPGFSAFTGTIFLVVFNGLKVLAALWIITRNHVWQTFVKETSPILQGA